MIIVEGPDGAGKSTLIKKLMPVVSQYWGGQWTLAPRAVSQETEALVDLKKWTDDNLSQGFQLQIFDRHRLLSDPIYRVVLGKPFESSLYSLPWLSEAWDTLLTDVQPYIIYCLPPLDVVRENLKNDKDNLAVVDHIDQIYMGYVSQLATLNAMYDSVYVFDYTEPNAFNKLLDTLGADF